MKTEQQTEAIVERLVKRVEHANTYFLKKIGSSVKKIKELKPSEAHQLVQMLKYGGNYEEIVKRLSEITDLNIKEIDDIFSSYAKSDTDFAEKFYEYRDIPFTPFEQNQALKTQEQVLSNLVKNELYNFTRDNVLGYTIDGEFHNLRDTYNQVLDEALLNVYQGKESFDSAMSRIMEDIGGSGLKTLDYESGRSIRLDSAVRMHLNGRLAELHNENQKILGEGFGADGVEISVHINPAPDHEEVQGRQFSIVKGEDGLSEWEKLQTFGTAKDYKGRLIDMHMELKNGDLAKSFRPISEYNCYHYIFPVILGISEPEYSDEDLKNIIKENNKKVKIDGKQYTKYQCTQLQRNLERKIREEKDKQILAKASGNEELLHQSQERISQLTQKYYDVSRESGLPTQIERLQVNGYRPVKDSKPKVSEEKTVSAEYLLNDYYKKELNYDDNMLELMKDHSLTYQKDINGLNDIFNSKEAKDIIEIRGHKVKVNLHKENVNMEESFKKYKENSTHMNNLLKKDTDAMPMPDTIKEIEDVSSSLKKAKTYEGTVWRYDDRQILPKEGEILEIPNFYSTSFNKAELDMVPYFTTRKTLYKIKSKTGKLLDIKSKYTNENEVLFDLNSSFKVIEAKTENGRNYVVMEEIKRKKYK